MPDITMCDGVNCPLKMKCYRFLAKPDGLQSYFVDTPYDQETQQCEHYCEYKQKEQQ